MSIIDPNTDSGVCVSRIRCSHSGWRWTARLLPAVLACTFASAGQAQTVYHGGLDNAVDQLVRTLVNEARLSDKDEKVLVQSEDFFELETELRLGLSELLQGRSVAELTSRGVSVAMAGSDEDASMVLHGRWRREPRGLLYLELFVAAPVAVGDPTALKSVRGFVPIDESIGEAIEATLDHWGRLLVLRLERGVRDRNRRRVLLHPMTIEGDDAQGGRLGQFLTNWLGSALVGSRLFTLVEPPPGVVVETDGQLYVAATIHEGQVEVSLRVVDNEYQRVTFATVGLDEELFRPGVIGPDVTAELAKCAGLVDAGNLEGAKECYEGVRAGAPGDTAAVEGVRAGLERVAGLEEEEAAVRGVRDAIGRGELGEAKEGLERLRGLNAGHPRLVELEGEIARAELRVGRRFRDCPGCPELVVVPGGQFGHPFAVGVYEVTFGEWDACVSGGGCGGYRPDDRGWGRGSRPVMNVSWHDAQAYVDWLSGKTGKGYRLLSESEWVYVARAGTTTNYWWGNDVGRNRANCDGCGSRWDRKQTAPVGSFSANPFGLYDVHGNVWEWVEDCWEEDCGRRVVRGGSWNYLPSVLRSAFRYWNSTGVRDVNYGFRIARTLMP